MKPVLAAGVDVSEGDVTKEAPSIHWPNREKEGEMEKGERGKGTRRTKRVGW